MSNYNHNAVYEGKQFGLSGAMLTAQLLIWFATKGDMHGYNSLLNMVRHCAKKA